MLAEVPAAKQANAESVTTFSELALSAGGTRLLSGSGNGSIRSVTISNPEKSISLTGHQSSISIGQNISVVIL